MSREPSMEEILTSIRRVIARDESARDAALSDRFGSERFEGDAVGDDTRGNAATGRAAEEEDVLDLSGLEDGMAAPAAAAPAVSDPVDTAPLVSPDSADAARQSLGHLASALNRSDTSAPSADAAAMPGMTIEALAEAALRPMLKQWLDTNLPPMVERLVAREIARITGGRI
jgi:uncharacterized protein